MIKFSVPAIFDLEMLDFYKKQNELFDDVKIAEVYGSLPNCPIGSARERRRLQFIENEKFEDYIRLLKKIGIDFNYTFNSSTICLDDLFEQDLFADESRAMLYLKWLRDIGVKILTIASPIFVHFVKNNFGNDFVINSSTISHIDSFRALRQFLKFGCDRITLSLMVNRDFDFLERVKDCASKELLVNEFCGRNCAIRYFHYNMQSLNCKSEYKCDEFFKNYPYNICTKLFLSSREEVLTGNWISPNWIDFYHDKFSIEYFKITGRTVKDINWHKFVIQEYMEKDYSKNILDLGPLVLGRLENEGKKSELYIDAKELDTKNFLDFFIDKRPNCRIDCKSTCFYCYEFFKRKK